MFKIIPITTNIPQTLWKSRETVPAGTRAFAIEHAAGYFMFAYLDERTAQRIVDKFTHEDVGVQTNFRPLPFEPILSSLTPDEIIL